MGGQNGVVGFNDSCRHLGSGVDGKFQFGLFAVVAAEPFHEKRGESRSGTSSKGMEDQETLESGTLISQFADPKKIK